MATKTSTIGLNQYVGSDYVKMADFNADNLAIDNAIKEDRAKMDAIEKSVNGMELVDSKIRITDAQGHFTGETLDVVLDELKTDMDSIETTATGTSYTDTTTQIGATNVQQAIEKTVEKVNTTNTNLDNLKKKIKENRTVVASTLTASKWQGNTYSFETEYPHAQYDIAIELGESATLEQAYAFADACLKGSIGTQVITALDIVPTIDIPITIEVIKKWE